MADQSVRIPEGVELEGASDRIWTFHILSGPTFRLDLPRSPSLDFQGRPTLWKMIGKEGQATAVAQLLRGMSVVFRLHVETETEEQKAERKALRDGQLDKL